MCRRCSERLNQGLYFQDESVVGATSKMSTGKTSAFETHTRNLALPNKTMGLLAGHRFSVHFSPRFPLFWLLRLNFCLYRSGCFLYTNSTFIGETIFLAMATRLRKRHLYRQVPCLLTDPSAGTPSLVTFYFSAILFMPFQDLYLGWTFRILVNLLKIDLNIRWNTGSLLSSPIATETLRRQADENFRDDRSGGWHWNHC